MAATDELVVWIGTPEQTVAPVRVDVCDDHGKTVRGLWEVAADVGQPATEDAPAPTKPKAGPKKPVDQVDCPECGISLNSTSLVTHLYAHAGIRQDQRPRSGLTCPTCGKTFATAVQTGNHRRGAHGWDPMADVQAALAAYKADHGGQSAPVRQGLAKLR